MGFERVGVSYVGSAEPTAANDWKSAGITLSQPRATRLSAESRGGNPDQPPFPPQVEILGKCRSFSFGLLPSQLKTLLIKSVFSIPKEYLRTFLW